MDEQDYDIVLFEMLTSDPKDTRRMKMMDEDGAVLLAAISATLVRTPPVRVPT